MGLFGFLGGKKPQAAQAPARVLSPWQESLSQAEHTRGFAWQDDNAPAREFIHAMLERAAPEFGNAKVVDAEPQPSTSLSVRLRQFGGSQTGQRDRNVELHGTCEGVPLRIVVSLPAKKIWLFEARCEDTADFFTIIRNPARIPQKVDASDAWAKDEPQCVFIGKGIYFDDSVPDNVKSWMIPSWKRTLPEAQDLLLQQMETLDLSGVELSNVEDTVLVFGTRTLEELEDPAAYLRSCTAFVTKFAKLHSNKGRSAHISFSVRESTQQTVVCQYCRSIFVFTAEKHNCPNCGAPAEC